LRVPALGRDNIWARAAILLIHQTAWKWPGKIEVHRHRKKLVENIWHTFLFGLLPPIALRKSTFAEVILGTDCLFLSTIGSAAVPNPVEICRAVLKKVATRKGQIWARNGRRQTANSIPQLPVVLSVLQSLISTTGALGR